MSAPARIARLVGLEVWKASRSVLVRIGLLAVVAATAVTALVHDPVAGESGWRVASLALLNGRWTAEIFLVVLGATAIAGESAQGTLKMVLPHAYTRADWIGAKAIALVVVAAVLLVLAAGTALVCGTAGAGLGHVTQEIAPEFGMTEGVTYRVLHSRADMAERFASAAAATFASFVATAALGLLVSSLFSSVVPALLTSFLLFFGLATAGVLFGASRDVLSQLYSWYPGEMLTLSEKLGRALNEDWNPALLSRGLLLAGATTAGALLVSLVAFSRRDLHS
jgi:ABC-type transport system involved in multi-copper enzyme maturation permease subunit